MARRILIIIGHPDPGPSRFCRALADAYAQGALQAGHEVRRIDVAQLDFPWLRSQQEFERGEAPASLKDAIDGLLWAEHLVLVFPLWLGTMPALLKAFLEQVIRPGVAFAYKPDGSVGGALLNGRSARIVVTMGMPSLLYRFWFFDHGIAGLRRGILNFAGIKPVRETLFGLIGAASEKRRQAWIETMRRLGGQAA